MIVTIGSRKLAIGVEWSYADSKATVKAHIKSVAGKHFVILASDVGENWVGTTEVAGNDKDVYAGAALLGLVAPNAIIAQSIGDGQSWVCVIQDGKPVAGHDLIVSAQDSDKSALGMMSMFQRADLYGDVSGAKASIETLIAELDASVQDKTISKTQLSACSLKRSGSGSSRLLYLGVLMVVVVAGFVGWNQYKNLLYARNRADANLKSMAFDAMNAQQKAEEKARLIAGFKKAVADKRQELVAEASSGSPLETWKAWSDIRKNLPISAAGGYKPQAMKCTVAECTVDWSGTGRFTRIQDKVLITDKPDPDTSLGRQVKSIIPVTLANAAQENATSAQMVASGSGDEFRMNLTDFMNGAASIEPLQPVAVSPPPNTGLSPVIVGQRGVIKISSNEKLALLKIHDAIIKLNALPVSLKTVSFTGLGGTINIQVEAAYVIVGPSI